jgi:hypothetical protein
MHRKFRKRPAVHSARYTGKIGLAMRRVPRAYADSFAHLSTGPRTFSSIGEDSEA